MSVQVVSVYGYGRFGRLWSDILAKHFHVKVFSRRGLGPDEVSPGMEICNEREIFACDAIFFCVAISSFAEVLQRSTPYFQKETIYFDTCSVKVLPARWMQKYLPAGSTIIATHPMFGPDSYPQSPGKLPMVMCNISAAADTFDEWVRYFTSQSMQVELMTPDEHDEMAAYSQGITHYAGRLLAELRLQPTAIDTLGYTRLLDIMGQTCNDSWQLFLDLQRYNPYTRRMRDDLARSIARINSVIEEKVAE